MDRQAYRRTCPVDWAVSRAAALVVLALAMTISISAAGQDRPAAVKQWRPVPSRPQSNRHPIDPSLPPSARVTSKQASYEDMPYVGEYIDEPEMSVYSGTSPCQSQCGCGQQHCCPQPLSFRGPFACGSWISAEYLLWSISGSDLPPLVTTSPAGTLPANTGILGRAGTGILFGGDSDDLTRSGFRIAGGWWLDAAQTSAFELEYVGLPRQTDRDSFNSTDFPLLARPVFDTALGAEAAMVVAHPNLLTGNIAISQSSQFHLAGAVRRDRLTQTRCRTVDSLIGVRFASLEESLLIEQSSRFPVGQGQIIAGTTLDLFDRFETENRFYGVTLGLDARERMGAWTFSARGALGLGNSRNEVSIDGATVTAVPGAGSSTAVGGLLAQQTNIGNYTRNNFTLMPELTLGLSTQLNQCWEIGVGYHLLYWSHAARPAGQIDRRVSQFPPEPPSGTFNPAFVLDTRGVLIHGLQTGLTYRF
jgi:hypothetical protein